MMRSVFLRTLYDKRWFCLGWALAMAGISILMIAMFPSLKNSMDELAASMPPALQGLVGDVGSFSKLDSYISSQLYDIRIPLFLMVMAVVLGLAIGPAQEEKGALRTLLSTSTSRSLWFIQTWLSAAVIFAAAIFASCIATLITASGIGHSLDTMLVGKLALISWSFAMCVFTIVFGIGMAVGSRSVALAVGVSLIVASIILEAGRTVDWLDSFQYVSLLHYYDASKLLKDGVNPIHQLVIGNLTLISFLVAVIVFRRRDIS